jgi:hypothetical protein
VAPSENAVPNHRPLFDRCGCARLGSDRFKWSKPVFPQRFWHRDFQQSRYLARRSCQFRSLYWFRFLWLLDVRSLELFLRSSWCDLHGCGLLLPPCDWLSIHTVMEATLHLPSPARIWNGCEGLDRPNICGRKLTCHYPGRFGHDLAAVDRLWNLPGILCKPSCGSCWEECLEAPAWISHDSSHTSARGYLLLP